MAGAGATVKSSSPAHVVPGLGRLKQRGLEQLQLLGHLSLFFVIPPRVPSSMAASGYPDVV